MLPMLFVSEDGGPPQPVAGRYVIEVFDPPDFPSLPDFNPITGADRSSATPNRPRPHPYFRVQFFPAPSNSFTVPHLQGQPPAAEKAVTLLRALSSSDFDHSISESADCTVCMEALFPPIADGEDPQDNTVLSMPCKHPFHRKCLVPWLKQSNTCPSCRYELPTANREYDIGVARRMRDRARARCAMVGIACHEEEPSVSRSASTASDASSVMLIADEVRNGELVLHCGCRFHQSCLAVALRVAGYNRREPDDNTTPVNLIDIVTVEDIVSEEEEERDEVMVSFESRSPSTEGSLQIRCPRCRRPGHVPLTLFDGSDVTEPVQTVAA